jgi:adenylate cyclase class 2
MTWEVELKFRVADLEAVRKQLAELGTSFLAEETQIDQYFAHPARDFAATDEALRIRGRDERCWITYKGPKQPGVTKTRREIELALADPGVSHQLADLLEALGFRTVAFVKKRRVAGHLQRGACRVGVALDRVDRLGQFVELEIVAPPREVAKAQKALLALAQELDLSGREARSYLEMLLSREETS